MKHTKTSKNTRRNWIRVEIVVATLGLLGTIIAALISAWSNLAKEKLLLNASQTAEATHVPVTIDATTTITLQPTNTTERHWEEFFNVEMSQSLCHFTTTIVPESLSSYLGKPNAWEMLITEETDSWSFGPDTSYPVSYFIDISNISNNTVWPKISNSFQFTVSWVDNAPNHANVILNGGGCGGGSWRDTDTIVSLSPDFLSTKQKATFTDSDYYTLQPGESEIFIFPVRCKGPGIYLLDSDISYTVTKDWDDIIIKSSKYIVCPETYSRWDVNPINKSIVFYKNFSWDNGSQSYVEAP